jgi:hypothetical protein
MAVAETQKLHEEPPVAYLPLSVSNPAFFRDVELLCHLALSFQLSAISAIVNSES